MPATAQPVPLDCDLFGAVENVEYGTDAVDYYVLNLAAGQSIWLDGRGFNETIGCTLSMELPDGSLPLAGFLRLMYFPEVPQTGRPKPLLTPA